ncbi:uncharacterized protein LOC121807062 [Salvia splendens]|uniref:uncharacterized protein LOC121807062 n=1 Tax=Salvia splendens TaxID=180675 RepID=UPI001C271215|nr:uncharacterized protein LOC121807062 [Salvia splendens]
MLIFIQFIQFCIRKYSIKHCYSSPNRRPSTLFSTMKIEDQIRRELAEAPIVAESVEAPIEENRRSTSAVVPTSSAKKNFISQIDNEIQRRPDFNWREIDLLSCHAGLLPSSCKFPLLSCSILDEEKTIEIIDNSKPHKNMDPFEKYDIDIGLMVRS